ncbi:MAG: hypothetical protein U0230_23795 [Polyangiales bacterium]
MSRWRPLSIVLVLAAGCGPEVRTTRAELFLAYAADPGCRPSPAPTEARLEALGDFSPADVPTSAIVSFDAPTTALDLFPFDTVLFRAEGPSAGRRFGGVVPVPRGASVTLRLLPDDLPCALDGAGVTPRTGQALVALPSGAALFVGGAEGTTGTREVMELPLGESFVTPTNGLLLRRIDASATWAGTFVVVAGGTPATASIADDSFEVLDAGSGETLRDRAGTLLEARTEHGAAALPDGRVLLVGGSGTASGPPLDTAELVDPGTGRSVAVGKLPHAVRRPGVVALDDGTVLVLGGLGAGGSPYSTPTVAAFDAPTATFLDLTGSSLSVPPLSGLVAVPLVGARAVVLGTPPTGSPAPILRVFRRVPPDTDAIVLEASDVDLRSAMPALTSIVAAPLADGKLFVAGLDSGSVPRGFVVDVGSGEVVAIGLRALPASVLALSDGSLLLLDAAGPSLLRTTLVTAYDNPPSNLVASELAFDAQGRWAVGASLSFQALANAARFDLPLLRFRGLRADFLVESGAAELLLFGDGGVTHSILVTDSEVGLGLCTVPRVAGESVRIARSGEILTLSTNEGTRDCRATRLAERIGLAVRADLDARVRAPSVKRSN